MKVYIWREPNDVWIAENGSDTVMFSTYNEAWQYAHEHWRARPCDIAVVTPPTLATRIAR